ncbi:MAG: sensor histidine kinase [Bacteroidia bacterium]
MKRKIGSLFLWFLLVEALFNNRNELINHFDLSVFVKLFDSFESTVQILTSWMAFFTYSLGVYLILYATYPRKKYFLATISILIFVPLALGFRFLLQEILMEAALGFDNYRDDLSWRYYVLDNIFYAVVFTTLGIVYFLVQYSKHTESRQSALQIEHQKTELALLRSQINPHFLFNILNNIYTLVYQKSEHALGAMEKLSGLLRYTLYEPQEWVPLQKEWDYLEDYIALQKLRYPHEVEIEISMETGLAERLIPPFVLIPFVENAFKHADLKAYPLIISFGKTEDQLKFLIQNHIGQHEKDAQGGIGLKNVRRRLMLLYGASHHLDIQHDSEIFSVNLSLPLTHEKMPNY